MSLLLFDLDGTLYSSRDILPEAYRLGIRQFNEEFDPEVEVPSDAEIFNQVGKPAPEIYENLFPNLSDRETVALQERIFSALVEGIQQKQGTLYEGVHEVLHQLGEQFNLGLVTNGQRLYMESVVETHDLDDYFKQRLSHDDAPNGKKYELVEMMLEFFETDAGETLLVGDRRSDFEAAREHGVSFLLCRYGYGERDRFPEESSTLETFHDLIDHERLPEPNAAPSTPDSNPTQTQQ